MKMLFGLMFLMVSLFCSCEGTIPADTMAIVKRVNRKGPFLGLVVPNAFELTPILQSPNFTAWRNLPHLDYGGRRFRFGKIDTQKVIIVMTGLSMMNAATTTQLLLTLFDVEGVLHPGIAGNADSSLMIGDVTIAKAWAHLGLLYWQRYGDDENDELSLEVNGDYTREIGFLKFSDYNNQSAAAATATDNLLNRLWYQPDEIFPVTGVPEVREHAFFIPVDPNYLQLANQLQGIELERCANATTCLPRAPKLVMVERGSSAATFVDNAAYRTFLRNKFNVTPIDMESAGVAQACLQFNIPFIAIRSLSDLAGGGSELSNEADLYGLLAAQNAATVMVHLASLIGSTTNIRIAF